MPIQFPQLLQDSWNFMRNQRVFSLSAILCFAMLQALSLIFSPKVDLNSPEQLVVTQAVLLPMLLSSLATLIMTILIILNIKSINNGQKIHFFQPLGQAFSALFPIIGLNILLVLPLSIGASFVFVSQQAGSNLVLMALPLLITGLYVLIKLSLVSYAYLIDDLNGVFASIRFTWSLSRGRMLPLVLYCVIAYFVPQMLVGIISGLAGMIVGALIYAFLAVYLVVFSFRFYQVYRQGAE